MRTPWLSNIYLQSQDVKAIKKVVAGVPFTVLINPKIGSWAVLSQEESDRYNKGNLNETELETLYLRGLATDADGNMVSLEFPSPAEMPSVVVVNITTRCNLRCLYCFAECDDTHGEDMPEEIMRKVIEEMLAMPSESITFELQGGEPLLYMDGLQTFLKIAEELNRNHKKIVKYRAVTNGTLIDDHFIQLAKKYDIRFGISIDGPKELNDKVRVYPDGRGAFDDIIAGLERVQKTGLVVDGSVCTLGQHNCEHAAEIVDFFSKYALDFKPRPANILGREIESMTTTRPGQWSTAYKELFYKSKQSCVTNFAIHIFEENAYTPVRDYICLRYPCGAAREILSVNPDGTVYPCDGFKGEATFSMGNILKESLKDMLQKEWVIKLKNRTDKDIVKCSKCIYRAMCCSCCYSAFGAYGTVYREDPHCEDRHKIFDFLIEQWILDNILIS